MRNKIRSLLYRAVLQGTALAERPISGATRSETSIREVLPGDMAAQPNRNICVFAHYDRQGRVDPHVLFYLQHLRAAGWGIIFVSTAPSLDAASIDALSAICRSIILRDNRGYDFGSYKAGILQAGDLTRYDALLIANDSVFGPLRDLGPIFDKMAHAGADFWGITDSREVREHLQSYFICLTRPVLLDTEFQRYWQDFPLFRSKYAVIWHGELGLSRLLRSCGYRMGAFCPEIDIAAKYPDAYAKAANRSRSGQVNPSRAFWRELIETFNAPFLKVELLRDNSHFAPGIENWQETVKKAGSDPKLFEIYLARMHATD